ncbi:ANFV protein, partial [Amia calva]|nr:ANFV protein [Amia calva]
MAKLDVFYGFLILFLLSSAARASSLFNRYNAQELDSLKDLIEQLEEKMTPNDEGGLYPGSEVFMDSLEDDALSPEILRQPEESPSLNPSRPLQETPARSHFRDLAGLTRTAKSFSSCFGNRIERIGSWSGLGCNTSKLGPKKRLFGN